VIHFSEMICLLGPTAGPSCKCTELSSGCHCLWKDYRSKAFFFCSETLN